jgi:hypothetical protein
MTGDKILLKEVQMGKGGQITYGDGVNPKSLEKESLIFQVSGHPRKLCT